LGGFFLFCGRRRHLSSICKDSRIGTVALEGKCGYKRASELTGRACRGSSECWQSGSSPYLPFNNKRSGTLLQPGQSGSVGRAFSKARQEASKE
jgi:hypothetical protein